PGRAVPESGTEIGFYDVFVHLHLLGRSLREHLALRHHDDGVAETTDEIHVMLYHAECVAAFPVEPQDGFAERVEKRAVDASADLVEEDDPRLDHHCTAEFQKLLLAAGQVAGG